MSKSLKKATQKVLRHFPGHDETTFGTAFAETVDVTGGGWADPNFLEMMVKRGSAVHKDVRALTLTLLNKTTDSNWWAKHPPITKNLAILNAMQKQVRNNQLKMHILSSPVNSYRKEECIQGKGQWLQEWVNVPLASINFTSDKQKFANSTSLLIDDR